MWKKPGPANSPAKNGVGTVEDPFVWMDAGNHFHVIAHRYAVTALCDG